MDFVNCESDIARMPIFKFLQRAFRRGRAELYGGCVEIVKLIYASGLVCKIGAQSRPAGAAGKKSFDQLHRKVRATVLRVKDIWRDTLERRFAACKGLRDTLAAKYNAAQVITTGNLPNKI